MIFLALSALWVSLVYAKYGILTTGKASSLTWAVIAPGSPGFPWAYKGLYPPPPAANSVWDDPTLLPADKWSPLSSWNNLRHLLNIISTNIFDILRHLNKLSAFALVFLILYAINLTKSVRRLLTEERACYLVITMLIFPIGYLFIFIEPRYILPIFCLSFIIFGISADLIRTRLKLSKVQGWIFLTLIILSFYARPALIFSQDIDAVRSNYRKVLTLKKYGMINSRFASNDSWGFMVTYAYHLNSRYYGMPNLNRSTSQIKEELNRNKIDYFIAFHQQSENFLHDNFANIISSHEADFRIYKRISKK